jgi:excisionase family DNA binding protein
MTITTDSTAIQIWFNSKQAAAYIGVSQPTFRKMVKTRIFIAHQYGSRQFFNRQELDTALLKR